MYDVAGPVADDLDFNVTGTVHEAFDEDAPVSKGGQRFRCGRLVKGD